MVGLIVAESTNDPTWLPVDLLSVHTSAVEPDLVNRARQEGKAIHVWTVNDPKMLIRMAESGVDNVITARPAEMRAILKGRAGPNPAR